MIEYRFDEKDLDNAKVAVEFDKEELVENMLAELVAMNKALLNEIAIQYFDEEGQKEGIEELKKLVCSILLDNDTNLESYKVARQGMEQL